MPLVMFYFPLVKQKLAKSSQNTLATLEILEKYYEKKDIQGFLDVYDSTGAFFNNLFTSNIKTKYSFLYGSFVPSIVQYEIETNPLNLSFWTHSNSSITFSGDLDQKKVINVFLYLRDLFPISKKYKYDIKIFGTSLKKTLPDKENTFLTPRNVNSGLSIIYYNSDIRQIFIFRKEEYLKVFIHEFLHTISCQNGIDKIESIMEFLDSIGTITTPIFNNSKVTKDELDLNYISTRNPNEALTELSANILNLLITRPQKDFIKNFEIERKFSLFQCAKILEYFGVTDITQLHQEKIIKQTTNVIPYYILRAMLYHNPSKLFEFYEVNKSLCYSPGSEQTKILEEMITKFTPEFISDINYLIKWIKKNTAATAFWRTLRMTIFG
jgi:hypothetical protein